MPPRFVFWTLLIDGKPTAFRARDREELLPPAVEGAQPRDPVGRALIRRLPDTAEQANEEDSGELHRKLVRA